jgi:DNA-binding transcriptional ArsR family regulator
VDDLETREIKDSKVLAAMSHPLRRRLLDVLRVAGPSTVSSLAGHTGQAVGNISHHLRVLAASGLVEEVPELARDRRERWWRRTSARMHWSPRDFGDDPVADAATSLNLDHAISIARSSFAARETYGEEWHEAAFATDGWASMSAAEMTELAGEVLKLLNQWTDRVVPDDGQEREPVFLFAYGVPARP